MLQCIDDINLTAAGIVTPTLVSVRQRHRHCPAQGVVGRGATPVDAPTPHVAVGFGSD